MVYSFAWYGMYVDLGHWVVANVPMANGTSFRYFFGDLPPSFCIYRCLKLAGFHSGGFHSGGHPHERHSTIYSFTAYQRW